MNTPSSPAAAMLSSCIEERYAETPQSGEDSLAMLILDGEGVITECDRRGEALFGYACNELIGCHVSLLVPELAKLALLQDGQPNSRLRYRSRIGYRFQVITRDGQLFPAILFLNCLDNGKGGRISLLVRRV